MIKIMGIYHLGVKRYAADIDAIEYFLGRLTGKKPEVLK
jgi:hypothetical protein